MEEEVVSEAEDGVEEGLGVGGSRKDYWRCVWCFDMGLARRWWMEACVCFGLLGQPGCTIT